MNQRSELNNKSNTDTDVSSRQQQETDCVVHITSVKTEINNIIDFIESSEESILNSPSDKDKGNEDIIKREKFIGEIKEKLKKLKKSLTN